MPLSKNKILKKAEWTSASNIALIKYWGKRDNQIPANASLSMTLRNSVSRTIVSVIESENPIKTQFFFGGNPAPEFEPKIDSFIKKISNTFPFLKSNSIIIESWNTFPHSAGIASSASAMSALALCICDVSGVISQDQPDKSGFFRKASEIARHGSGSATRSVYGGFSVWGRTSLIKDSSDEYAVPLDFRIHKVFAKLQDAILIVSSAKKKISSTAGHQLMNSHPFATERYKQAERNMEIILNALKIGNIADFIRVTENEALGLHSLMMSSDPGYMLIEPGTIQIINKVRDYREKTGRFLCFTLDAGPNVHLIYPEYEKKETEDFIDRELSLYCENRKILWDECGEGPDKLQ